MYPDVPGRSRDYDGRLISRLNTERSRSRRQQLRTPGSLRRVCPNEQFIPNGNANIPTTYRLVIISLIALLSPRFGGYTTSKGVIEGGRFELFALMLGVSEAELLPQMIDSGGGGPRHRGRNKAAFAKSERDLDAMWGFEEL